jgi:hypothetical protein
VDESRLGLAFPLSSKVFLDQHCASGVEGVQEPAGIARHGQTIPSSPPTGRLILDMQDWAQKPVSRGVCLDFHFYEPSTVTTGFIGFYFDIREVLKVAPSDGRFGLCR